MWLGKLSLWQYGSYLGSLLAIIILLALIRVASEGLFSLANFVFMLTLLFEAGIAHISKDHLPSKIIGAVIGQRLGLNVGVGAVLVTLFLVSNITIILIGLMSFFIMKASKKQIEFFSQEFRREYMGDWQVRRVDEFF